MISTGSDNDSCQFKLDGGSSSNSMSKSDSNVAISHAVFAFVCGFAETESCDMEYVMAPTDIRSCILGLFRIEIKREID